MVQRPLQRLEVRHVALDVIRAVRLHRELFAHANRAVLERSEDSRGHEVVVHLFLVRSIREDASHQPHTRLDGYGRELLARVEHVADGVNVIHVGLLVYARDFTVLRVELDASRGKVQAFRNRVSSDGAHDGVESFLKRVSEHGVFKRYFDLAILLLFERRRLRIA